MGMCVTSCPHCHAAPFDTSLMRCDLCDTWSHLLGPGWADVCLSALWAHSHGMVTLQERIDAHNKALRGGIGQQMTLWG